MQKQNREGLFLLTTANCQPSTMKKIFSILAIITLLTACTGDYGKKLQLGRGELFYTEQITEAEAKQLGQFLQDNAWVNDEARVSYQIDKEGSHYVFKMVLADEKFTKDAEYIANMEILAGFMSRDAFANKPVDLWLCNDKFEPLYKVPYKALSDSIIKKAEEEELQKGKPAKDDGMPKDDVSPVDTSEGMPA